MAQSKNVRKIFGEVEVTGNQHVGDAGDGFDIKFDGTNTLNIDPANANDVVRIGETNQADLQVDGATDLLWDASAGSLTNGGMLGLYAPDGNSEDLTTAAPAASITVSTSYGDTTANAVAATLADGTVAGQLKIFVFEVDGANAFSVTPATAFADTSTSITFDDANDFCVLVWNGSAWRILINVGGTLA